ncbi:MAG: DUF4234 domain-containing protein [Solirubrobacteraceae bacterium]|nr:DUF4234 domain-containing protein [Patulibacter sp.]
MATIVPIQGGPETAKIRSVFAPALLPFITLGIYTLVWYYKVNRELRDLGRKHGREDLGTSPGMSLFAVTFGALIVVPAVISIANTYKRTKRAQQLLGFSPDTQANPWIFGLCYVFIQPVAWGYLQNELNKVWTAQQGGVAQPVEASAPNFMKA